MNQGQIQHVFSFILIGIVLVATIYLSITLLGTISEKACRAEYFTFEKSLDEISRTYDTIGTKQNAEIIAPCGAEFLCVISNNSLSTNIPTGFPTAIQEHLKIAASLAVPRPNVFIFEGGVPQKEFTHTKFILDQSIMATCINSSGSKFIIHTEGHGRTISVSEP